MIRKIQIFILKTLPMLFCPLSKKRLIHSTDWIPRLSNLYRFFLILGLEYPIHYFLFGYTNKIKTELVEKENERVMLERAWLDYFNCSNDNIKFFMSRLFYYSNLFNEKIAKTVMTFALNTSNKEYRYWLAMDISFWLFHTGRGLYDGFYLDRRECLRKIALENKLSFEIDRNKRNNKSICILSYSLSRDVVFNSPSRITHLLSSGMTKYYDDVYVLDLDSFRKGGYFHRKTISAYRGATTKHKGKIKSIFSKRRISVYFSKGNSFSKRMQNTLDIISKINPSAILDLSDECSPESYFYSQQIPTFYIPLRNHASSSFFYKALGRTWKYEYVNRRFKSISNSEVCDWCFPEYIPPKKCVITKSDLHLEDDSFVVLTIGPNYQCPNSLADKMIDLLKNNPKIVWMFVGDRCSDYIRIKYPDLLGKQIIQHGFEKDLRSLCDVCDVVLRLNITGGSGGTAIAAIEGLPIVMSDMIVDPSRWLGIDFSSLHLDQELVNEVYKLYTNKSYYKEQSKRVQSLAIRGSDVEEKWSELFNIIEINKSLFETNHKVLEDN